MLSASLNKTFPSYIHTTVNKSRRYIKYFILPLFPYLCGRHDPVYTSLYIYILPPQPFIFFCELSPLRGGFPRVMRSPRYLPPAQSYGRLAMGGTSRRKASVRRIAIGNQRRTTRLIPDFSSDLNIDSLIKLSNFSNYKL